jgi:hypothetical protein
MLFDATIDLLLLATFCFFAGALMSILWRYKLAEADQVPMVIPPRLRPIWTGDWSYYLKDPELLMLWRFLRRSGEGPGERYRRAGRVALLASLLSFIAALVVASLGSN